MTTIAFDKVGVAWDGLLTAGNLIACRDAKKVVVRNGVILALTGLSAAMDPAIEWYVNGAKPSKMPKFEGDDCFYSLSVLDEEGFTRGRIEYYCSGVPYPSYHPLPFAAGAGSQYAYGVMWQGGCALRAIDLVVEQTTDSGGTPQYLAYAEVWPELRVAA